MYLVEKVVLTDGGANPDVTVTINQHTGKIDNINTLISHPNIPNTRGLANYSIVGGKPTFNFTGVGDNELWIYVNGVGFKAGGQTGIDIADFDFYANVISVTEYAAVTGPTRVLIVNQIGNYKVGNVVKLKAKHLGAFSSIYYGYYYGEITAVNASINQITVSLLCTTTTPASSEWTFGLVATDKAGLDYFLSTYKLKKYANPYVWQPTATGSLNIESEAGTTGLSKHIFVKQSNIAHVLNIQIQCGSVPENEVYTITNFSDSNITQDQGVTINASGGTFVDGTTSGVLTPSNVDGEKFQGTMSFMRVGTVIYYF